MFESDIVLKFLIALTQKVFLLLSFNGSFPIKKQDFADVVRGCSLTIDTSSQAISGLFNEFDIEKRGEISLENFQEAIPAENAQPKYIQFIQTALAKEQEILEFKKNRIRIRLGIYRFRVLDYNFNRTK